MRHGFTPALLMLVAIGTMGCAGFQDVMRSRCGPSLKIEVETSPGMNRDFPVPVDLVVVRDQGLLEELAALDALDWFARRAQLESDHAEKIEVHAREFVPGPRQQVMVVSHCRGVAGGLLFLGYGTPGEHRWVLRPLEPFMLVLGESEAQLRFEAPSAGP